MSPDFQPCMRMCLGPLQELPVLLAPRPEPEGIRQMDCSNNAIADLPPWLGSLVTLQNLAVAHNLLTCLPDSITQLRSLKVPTPKASQRCTGPLLAIRADILEHALVYFDKCDDTSGCGTTPDIQLAAYLWVSELVNAGLCRIT